MDQNERGIIDDLFGKVQQAEAQSGERDAEAEARIGEHVARQPAAPYYMAQAIVVQQDALTKAQSRIQELEREVAARPAGGFLSSLFGGGEQGPAAAPRERPQVGVGGHQPAGAGGFLGGAMQTALGVAGGFLIADALTGLMSGDEAAAAATPDAGPWGESAEDTGADPGIDDGMDGPDIGGFDDF